MSILESINSPADLRALPPEQLRTVADEIRNYILETMSRVGGHTGASLGAVELAVALHYAFDTPVDRLVWDVGHQAYAHKILTGRRELLSTIKQYGGLSGFLRRDESDYDTFGAGHASTSLSAALGMAIARDRKGDDHHVVALIGDASLAGGMAMEAINQAGHLKSRDGDAKEFEDRPARQREDHENSRHNQAGQPRHLDPLFRRIGGSHRQKGGNGRDRIDDDKERTYD